MDFAHFLPPCGGGLRRGVAPAVPREGRRRYNLDRSRDPPPFPPPQGGRGRNPVGEFRMGRRADRGENEKKRQVACDNQNILLSSLLVVGQALPDLRTQEGRRLVLFDFGVLFNCRRHAEEDDVFLDSWLKLLKSLNSWKENPWISLPSALTSLPADLDFASIGLENASTARARGGQPALTSGTGRASPRGSGERPECRRASAGPSRPGTPSWSPKPPVSDLRPSC